MTYNFKPNQAFAKELDANDELKDFRKEFNLPKDSIYMDGNSLGLMPKKSGDEVKRSLDEWGNLAIEGWLNASTPWFYLAEEVGKMMAPLVGAKEKEVIASGGTTINIHSMLATFYQPDGKRKKILADELNFPSDIYALKSFLKLKGSDPESDLVLVKSKNGSTLNVEDIVHAMTDEIALILLPSVLYRSGQLLNMNKLTKEAHLRNIIIGFDCSHSAGNVPHQLHNDEVDFAIWCGYKYLNGGPGSTGFMFVHEKHFAKEPMLAGWFGYKKEKQFDMSLDFDPERNAGGWQISTPNVLSLSAIKGSLEISNRAEIERIRLKSQKLTEYFIYLVQQQLLKDPYNYQIISPLNPEERSGHVAIAHPKFAWQINQALKEMKIVPDFRHPNIIRIAPIALYNSFVEVYTVVQALKEIMDKKLYLEFSSTISAVS